MTDKMPPHLTTLPPEVLHHIFMWLDPADIVVTLPHVCSAFRHFTKSNRKLHRDVYLSHLDTPENLDLDWETEIKDIVRLQAICHDDSAAKKKPEFDFVYNVVNRLLKTASQTNSSSSSCKGKISLVKTHADSLNVSLLKGLFSSQSTRVAFLQRSSLFERVRNERHGRDARDGPAQATTRQRSAKLHCLYGKPILNAGLTRSSRSARTYPYAASKVYDLRQYTRRTRWGPFLDDGSDRVDWEKVEAIIVVLGFNIGPRFDVVPLFREVWGDPFSGSYSKSILKRPLIAPPSQSLQDRDPYGVTGVWYRIVCFLDYNTFFSYNFPVGDLLDPDMPRPALDTGEATRLLMMKIHVTSIEDPGPDDGQDLPVVHFKGISRSLDNSMDDDANSSLRGTVRLTREGEVRWTTFSIFHGQERWRSEGVQVGGVQSGRGVVGHWFDRDYDNHGPAGPTAFWKAPEETPNRIENELLPADYFLPYGHFLEFDDFASDTDDPFHIDEDDEEDEEIQQLDVAEELPGLLLDAQRDVRDVLAQQAEQA